MFTVHLPAFLLFPYLFAQVNHFGEGVEVIAASYAILSSKNALTKSLLLTRILAKSEDKKYSKALGLVGRRKDQEDASTLQCRDSFVIN